MRTCVCCVQDSCRWRACARVSASVRAFSRSWRLDGRPVVQTPLTEAQLLALVEREEIEGFLVCSLDVLAPVIGTARLNDMPLVWHKAVKGD